MKQNVLTGILLGLGLIALAGLVLLGALPFLIG